MTAADPLLRTAEARVPKGPVSDRTGMQPRRSAPHRFQVGALLKQESSATVYGIAGGKGGIGKTVLTASLGAGLAALGNRVVVVDADFGGANLHLCLGVLEPERTFYDFFTFDAETLQDLLLDTRVANLKLISGGCGVLGMANPRFAQKLRFIRELKRLPGDCVLMDLGAGSSKNVLDYFLASDRPIVVTTPEPMALQECFDFVKLAAIRKLQHEFAQDDSVVEAIRRLATGALRIPVASFVGEIANIDLQLGARLRNCLASFRPGLILNRVASKADVQEALAVCTAARELLGIEVDFLGPIAEDPSVRKAVKELRPFLLTDTASAAARDLSRLIAVKLNESGLLRGLWQRWKLQKVAQMESRLYANPVHPGASPICSVDCFYWGNCPYQNGGQPCRVRDLPSAIGTR